MTIVHESFQCRTLCISCHCVVGLRNVVAIAMYKIVLAISMKLKVFEQFILSQLVWKLWFIEKGLNKMSASGEELRWESDTEQQGSFLPEYFTYLSLRFKFVVTLTTILVGELVIATVKTTRRLHKPYCLHCQCDGHRHSVDCSGHLDKCHHDDRLHVRARRLDRLQSVLFPTLSSGHCSLHILDDFN